MTLWELAQEITQHGNKTYPYGTLLCAENYQFYWSPILWNSPIDGLKAQPEKWLNLGSSNFWSGPKQKKLFEEIREIAWELFPQSIQEWCDLGEIGEQWRAADKDFENARNERCPLPACISCGK